MTQDNYMRSVSKSERVTDVSGTLLRPTLWGAYRCTLSCGHVEIRRRSTVPSRLKCRKCASSPAPTPDRPMSAPLEAELESARKETRNCQALLTREHGRRLASESRVRKLSKERDEARAWHATMVTRMVGLDPNDDCPPWLTVSEFCSLVEDLDSADPPHADRPSPTPAQWLLGAMGGTVKLACDLALHASRRKNHTNEPVDPSSTDVTTQAQPRYPTPQEIQNWWVKLVPKYTSGSTAEIHQAVRFGVDWARSVGPLVKNYPTPQEIDDYWAKAVLKERHGFAEHYQAARFGVYWERCRRELDELNFTAGIFTPKGTTR